MRSQLLLPVESDHSELGAIGRPIPGGWLPDRTHLALSAFHCRLRIRLASTVLSESSLGFARHDEGRWGSCTRLQGSGRRDLLPPDLDRSASDATARPSPDGESPGRLLRERFVYLRRQHSLIPAGFSSVLLPAKHAGNRRSTLSTRRRNQSPGIRLRDRGRLSQGAIALQYPGRQMPARPELACAPLFPPRYPSCCYEECVRKEEWASPRR